MSRGIPLKLNEKQHEIDLRKVVVTLTTKEFQFVWARLERDRENNVGRSDRDITKPRLKGTAIVYSTERDEIDVNTADFEVSVGEMTDPKQLRAYHLKQRDKGKFPQLSNSQLHRGVVLLVGPQATPNHVVHWLKQIITHVQKQELVIGRRTKGRFRTEPYIPGKRIRKRSVRHRKRPFITQL